jgi:hypothetical protein
MQRDQDAGSQPKRAGVHGALDTLENDVAHSLKLADELELRLSGLLKMSAPTTEVGADSKQSAPRDISSATSQVEGINNRVRGLSTHLSDLLSRLDL